MNEETKEMKSLVEILKHPLANVVIGFLLTGVLGTTITQYYLALREKHKAQYELTVARKESIAALATLNAEYLARAGMLLAAVERGDKTQVQERRSAFNDAALRWQIEKPATLLAAREALPEEVYLQFRDHLDTQFRDAFLVPFGKCMESAVVEIRDGSDVATKLKTCRARENLASARACSRVLLDMLYEISGYTVAEKTEQALQINQQKYRAELHEACSTPM